MSCSLSFDLVRNEVRRWFAETGCRYSSDTELKVIADDEGLFRVLINTKDRMGELLLANSDGAPYRYVSFQVLGLNMLCKEQQCFVTMIRPASL